jgi:YggT family protein
MMFQDALQFLLRIALELAATAFWLRFYMQLNRLPYTNSFAQFIVKVTDFGVRPVRRIIPGFFGLDWASLLLFYLAELLWALASHWLMGYPFMAAGAQIWPGFLLLALATGLGLIMYIFMALVAVQALISWINPFSPVAPVFYALARPVLRPFQRFIPPINGIDLSPMAAFIMLQLLIIAPIAGLERVAYSLIS